MRTALIVVVASVLLAGCASERASRGETQARASTAGSASPAPAIARVWRGRVLDTRADEYDAYLREGIAKFPTIPGNMGYQMMRRDLPDHTTEFEVISYWPSLDAIRAYAGEDIEKVRDLPRDHEFLVEREPTVRHYQIKDWLLIPGAGSAK